MSLGFMFVVSTDSPKIFDGTPDSSREGFSDLWKAETLGHKHAAWVCQCIFYDAVTNIVPGTERSRVQYWWIFWYKFFFKASNTQSGPG